MPRKFFKTVIQVTILSEDVPVGRDMRLHMIEHEITEGNCSGVKQVIEEKELTPREVTLALIEQDSDPEFFGLDEQGNEVEQ